jgi:uncharacterized membrane protein YbhN (UPF0104 family)
MNTYVAIYKKYPHVVTAVLFCISGFLVYFLTQPRIFDYFNYFSYLADAFLHGRLYLTDPPSTFEELIVVGGKHYEIYPPMPAIVLMPLVAIWGVSFNHVFLSLLMGGINISIVYLIMREMTENEEIRFWMTVSSDSGPSIGIWPVGSVWYFAQLPPRRFAWPYT